jgi:two-component system, cell cycle response regulator
MISIPVRMLLIEDNPGDARFMIEIVKEFPSSGFDIIVEQTLAEGIRRLEDEPFDIVLLDLGLPDSHGISTFLKLRDQELNVPILVLSGLTDEEVAIRAVKEGAQDYLVKGDLRPDLLYRAIRYAMERHSLQSELFAMSLVDPLTSLYNRRGFFKLARQELKTADRLDHGLLLLFLDLDNMKWINDTLGHAVGDQALIRVSELLRETFRESDVLGRIGGDEFVVLALNADQDIQLIKNRILQAISDSNARESSGYALSVSIGYTAFAAGGTDTLESMLERADAMMYAEKVSKKKARGQI